MGKNKRTKRLPAEVQAMVDGGLMLYRIISTIYTAVVALGGSGEHIRHLQNDSDLVKQIAVLIVNAGKQVAQWPVWKTIRLGTGQKTADDFRAAFKRGGNKISDWANDILGKPAFTVAAKETEVCLVKVTVAELGFKDGATYREICQRAKELGLDLCPAEVGPQLRLQYQDQPMGEWLIVAMEAISDSDGGLDVFCVERDGDGLWLISNYGRPGYHWGGGSRFVFVRSK